MVRSRATQYAHLRESDLEVTVPQLLENGGWAGVYDHKAPLALEIGLGKDPHLARCAEQNPGILHIGIEYSRKKMDKVLSKAIRQGVENLRLLVADATKVVGPLFPAESLQHAYILFPDPWPKKRHAKKRLVQHSLISTVVEKLAPGAEFELRTDDPDYKDQFVEVLSAQSQLENLQDVPYSHTPRDPETHVPTLFESKFVKRGRKIHYFYYRKLAE